MIMLLTIWIKQIPIDNIKIKILDKENIKPKMKHIKENNIYIYRNELLTNPVSNAENMLLLMIGENIRFRINGPIIERPIEVFMCEKDNFVLCSF